MLFAMSERSVDPRLKLTVSSINNPDAVYRAHSLETADPVRGTSDKNVPTQTLRIDLELEETQEHIPWALLINSSSWISPELISSLTV